MFFEHLVGKVERDFGQWLPVVSRGTALTGQPAATGRTGGVGSEAVATVLVTAAGAGGLLAGQLVLLAVVLALLSAAVERPTGWGACARMAATLLGSAGLLAVVLALLPELVTLPVRPAVGRLTGRGA
jgi:hypothetical protein